MLYQLLPDKFVKYCLRTTLRKISLNTEKIYGDLAEEEVFSISGDCCVESAEKVCNVPHFHMNDEKNQHHIQQGRTDYISSKHKSNKRVFREFENYSTELARAYNLCTYYELRKMGLV